MIVLRNGVELREPLPIALAFLEKWPETDAASPPSSFDEADLRLANRGGARISAAQIATILSRRPEIEHALAEIPLRTSLTAGTRSLPWSRLTELFDAFGGIHGVGFAKMTKALYKKRPALIPILDSVVQAYLATDTSGSFGERATELVRSYKVDVDRNGATLRELRRELRGLGHEITAVRLLDLLIWSASVAPQRGG